MIPAIEHLGLVDEEDIELDRAALELASLDHFGVDLSEGLALLEAMAAQLAQHPANAEAGPDGTLARARAIGEILGGAFDLDGDRTTYDAPANADLIQVLQRRRGLPVALGLIYVAVARRVGWTAHVLNTPGHVLVGIGRSPVVVIDPFDRGRVVGADDPGGSPRDAGAIRLEHLEPMTNRAVLVRLLMNLSSRAAGARDFDRALTILQRVTTAAPGYSAGWWERARLELATGAPSAARLSLNSMLETTQDPSLRRQVMAALARITT